MKTQQFSSVSLATKSHGVKTFLFHYWLIYIVGDLSLKQTETCPFRDGSYRVIYGFNGNIRCLGTSTNTIATVRIAGSQMTFDASGCTDYISDRTARGYPTTDATKIYGT